MYEPSPSRLVSADYAEPPIPPKGRSAAGHGSPSLRRFGFALGSIIRRFGRDAFCAGLDREYRPQLGEVHRPQHIVYVLAPARAFRMIGGSVLRAAAHVQP
jgi:hypothetical protein